LRSMTSVVSTTGDPDVGRSTAPARERIMAPAAADRAGYVAGQLAGLRIWGSPDCYDEARLTANATEAFDRCFAPSGTARQMMAIMASGSRSAALAAVIVPTLVIHGDADTLIDPSGGRRTADAVPGACFVLVEGLGHDLPPAYWDRLVALATTHTQAVDGRRTD
ncbi:MAG: alpha/beta fold hydrolase, partial [Acidimicrobiales bacterium]